MIHSMTAFARVQGSVNGLSLIWELRSVNHRFLETQFRLPEQLRSLEHGLRETLRRHVKRGKIDCSLRVDRAGGGDGIELNRALLLQLLAAVEQIRRDAPEIGPGSAMDVLRWPGIIGDASSLEGESLAQAMTDLFEEALVELIANRQREGTQLASVISERLDEIDSIAREVKALTASMSHEVRARLTQRLSDLKVQADEGRLEQEVALLAQRADVAEELDRLVIHVEEARSNLRGPGPHGRRLDFLTQELNREANTLGAKSVLAQTSQKAVDLKVAIEQIREQVQNVE
ncbi:MAG: YicC family protein [Pseudomonadales bacterium]|nr:YicC family protein [Pseudomonadales bacterium]NIX07626.1 YicC family protein [Pseudomonadales bacterium]